MNSPDIPHPKVSINLSLTLGENQFSPQPLVTVLSSKARAACVCLSVALQRLFVLPSVVA